MYGIVTPHGLALHHNGRSVPLPVTSVTPLGVDVAAACDALTPCQWCNKVGGCDCLDWMEFVLLDAPTHLEDEPCEVCGGMVCDCITPTAQAATLARISADPHDYNNLTKLDIPY